MKTVFLAFAYKDADRELAAQVEQLLASQNIRVTTGERLGGEEVTEKVKSRILQSDGLIALLTQREQLAGGGWTTHQWVKYELDFARDNQKRAIALIESGVNLTGPYTENERIPFERQNPLPAFLYLSATLGEWKMEIGRTVKVQILPPTLARKVGEWSDTMKCRHRFYLGGKYTDWKEVVPVPEPGGTFIYLEGVHDEHIIQLEVQESNSTWVSLATPQWVQIQLSRRVEGK